MKEGSQGQTKGTTIAALQQLKKVTQLPTYEQPWSMKRRQRKDNAKTRTRTKAKNKNKNKKAQSVKKTVIFPLWPASLSLNRHPHPLGKKALEIPIPLPQLKRNL
jgi:hypothetical protein